MGLHRYLKYGAGKGLLYPLYLHQKPIYDSGDIFRGEMCQKNYSMVLASNSFLNRRWDISASIKDSYKLHGLIRSRGKNFSLL
jgi:hypothetical protein